jgi:hypothetical protein
MKAMQRDSSARERERIREEKELQQLMGGKGQSTTSTAWGVKAGFKKISTTPASSGGTGWKTIGAGPQRSDAELRWGNNGEDDYDPAYPTPA